MRKIKLAQNKCVLVDDDDFDFLNQYKWQVIKYKYGNVEYAMIKRNKTTIYMHRLITNCPKGKEIDHIDGNGFNNQKFNLRICTHQENMRNKGLRTDNTSGYNGICFNKNLKRWVSRIKHNRKQIHLGYFDNKKDAALAYNKAAIKYHKEFARLNIL